MRIKKQNFILYEKRNFDFLEVPKCTNIYIVVVLNIFINIKIEPDNWKTYFTSVIIDRDQSILIKQISSEESRVT